VKIRQKPSVIRRNVQLGLLAAVLLLLAAVSGNAQDQSAAETSTPIEFLNTLSPQERAWLRDHPVIRVAQDPSWPPIEFADESGTPSGMTADYLRLVEGRLGVKFQQVKNLSWQEAYARMQRWEIDMTTSVAVTQERETFWAFTKPYMTIPLVIATRSDVTYIADLRELEGKKVVVVAGYVAETWIARDFPKIQLVRVETAQEALAKLQRGEVFACVENMLVVDRTITKLKMPELKITGSTPYNNAQCIAVRKDWAILAGILDQALDSISATERNAIFRKWLPLESQSSFDYTRLWPVAAILAVVLLGLVTWNWKLAEKTGSVSRRRWHCRRKSVSCWSPNALPILAVGPGLSPPRSNGRTRRIASTASHRKPSARPSRRWTIWFILKTGQ
jgi:two-component system sensor histidine kinase EvgS